MVVSIFQNRRESNLQSGFSQSLLAPCTPELIARVQSVLASPNSEDDLTKSGFSFQQYLSYASQEQDNDDSNSSTYSLIGSDEDIPFLDSPRKLQPHAALAGRYSLNQRWFGNEKTEPQEPAALPPQLAYAGADRRSQAVAPPGPTDHKEYQRMRSHGRQYSDSSLGDETAGYLSSSPSSSSSSSSSYLSTGSATSQLYPPMTSSPLEGNGGNFPFGLYPPMPSTTLPPQMSSLGYVPAMTSMYAPTVPHYPTTAPQNMTYFGHSQHGPHPAAYLAPQYPHSNMYHGSVPAYSQPYLALAYVNNYAMTSSKPSRPHSSSEGHIAGAPSAGLISSTHASTIQSTAIVDYMNAHMHAQANVQANPPSNTMHAPLHPSTHSKSWDQARLAQAYVPTNTSVDMSEAAKTSAPYVPLARVITPSESSLPLTTVTRPDTPLASSDSTSHSQQRPSVAISSAKSNASHVLGASNNKSTSTAPTSPRSKDSYERIVAKLKEIGESQGFDEAQAWALSQLAQVGKASYSKFCLELADLAKRDNCLAHSRIYYQVATQLNSADAKGWLEWAKMEEENGQLDLCEKILADGLRHCGANSESLVLRSVRVLVSRDKIPEARMLIGRMLSAPTLHALADGTQSPSPKSQDEATLPQKTSQKAHATQPLPPVTSGHKRVYSGSGLPSVILSAGPHQAEVRDWRIVLEGAMLEWRAGRPQLAHSILAFLQSSVPNRTQPYMYAADLFKREGKFMDAYKAIMSGLACLPNAGMLWFEALELQQQLVSRMPDSADDISSASSNDSSTSTSKNSGAHKKGQHTQETPESSSSVNIYTAPWPSSVKSFLREYLPRFVEVALANLSPELIWKFHLEVAAFFESRKDINSARRALGASVSSCPSNLLWRVWLTGARLELFSGAEKAARRLLVRAAKAVPQKVQSAVLLEYARVEEYLGMVEQARYILTKAKRDTKLEWKVFLENIMLEMRSRNFEAAISETRLALEAHPSAGRLWAILIQAHHFCHYEHFDVSKLGTPAAAGFEITKNIFHEALKEVPKSGEVWCEGARIAMHAGRLEEARRYLSFAVELTSQYGDTTIEFMRLQLLEQRRANDTKSSTTFDDALTATKPTAEVKAANSSESILTANASALPSSLSGVNEGVAPPLANLATDRLAQLCTHAEPNYGPIWTYCKQFPHDPSIVTMNAARQMLLKLEATDSTMDLTYQLLGCSTTDMETKRKLIFS